MAKDFYGPSTPAAEHEQGPGERVRPELFPAGLGQPVDASSEIHRLHRHKHAHLRGDLDQCGLPRKDATSPRVSTGTPPGKCITILHPSGLKTSTTGPPGLPPNRLFASPGARRRAPGFMDSSTKVGVPAVGTRHSPWPCSTRFLRSVKFKPMARLMGFTPSCLANPAISDQSSSGIRDPILGALRHASSLAAVSATSAGKGALFCLAMGFPSSRPIRLSEGRPAFTHAHRWDTVKPGT